jgi:hypothetical protein
MAASSSTRHGFHESPVSSSPSNWRALFKELTQRDHEPDQPVEEFCAIIERSAQTDTGRGHSAAPLRWAKY